MITDLPEGTWIEYTFKSRFTFGRLVVAGGVMCQQIGPMPTIGDRIYRGIWKDDDEFQVRKVYTYGSKNRR